MDKQKYFQIYLKKKGEREKIKEILRKVRKKKKEGKETIVSSDEGITNVLVLGWEKEVMNHHKRDK